jgi:hypothetical protein
LVLFEMVSGRRAFSGSDSEVLRQQLVEPVPLLGELGARAHGSALLDAIIQRATSKEQPQRFADARAMATALAEVVLELAPPAARRSDASVQRVQRVQPSLTNTPRRRGASSSGHTSRLLRAALVAVSCVALLAIVIAGGVIYLLKGPHGAERRLLLERVLSSVLHEPGSRR